MPGIYRLFTFSGVLRPQLALDHAAETFDGTGGDDALRCAADAEQQVDARAVARGHDRAGDVTVGDELDPGAGIADLLDELAVPGAVEHDDGDVLRGAVLG